MSYCMRENTYSHGIINTSINSRLHFRFNSVESKMWTTSKVIYGNISANHACIKGWNFLLSIQYVVKLPFSAATSRQWHADVSHVLSLLPASALSSAVSEHDIVLFSFSTSPLCPSSSTSQNEYRVSNRVWRLLIY